LGDIRRRTTSRARASDLTVKFPAKHDGTAGMDQNDEDRPAAPAFRARGGVCVGHESPPRKGRTLDLGKAREN
jgi:hypothetical protein